MTDLDLTNDPFVRLGERERMVATLLAIGFSNHEIAIEMKISVKTVDSHRAKVLAKTQVRNNVELARMALRCGLVTL